MPSPKFLLSIKEVDRYYKDRMPDSTANITPKVPTLKWVIASAWLEFRVSTTLLVILFRLFRQNNKLNKKRKKAIKEAKDLVKGAELLTKHNATEVLETTPKPAQYCPICGKRLKIQYSEALGLYDIYTGEPKIYLSAYLTCSNKNRLDLILGDYTLTSCSKLKHTLLYYWVWGTSLFWLLSVSYLPCSQSVSGFLTYKLCGMPNQVLDGAVPFLPNGVRRVI